MGDVANYIFPERLPVGDSVAHDADQGGKPEDDIVKMDSGDVRYQICFKGWIEQQENQ